MAYLLTPFLITAIHAAGWGAGKILASGSSEISSSPVLRFPVVQGGKWGFIGPSGKVAIQPRFEKAWDFSEGLACVQVGDERGYIDHTGKVLIKPVYYLAYRFSEGLAAVMVGASKWGAGRRLGKWAYIDKTGKVMISRFALPSDFCDGYAKGTWDGRTTVILNKKGGRVFGFLADARPFSEGFGALRAKRPSHWYFISTRKGRDAPKQKYAEARRFSTGLAAVKPLGEPIKGDKRGRREPTQWGYVNAAGSFVIKPQFDQAREFSEGLAPAALKGKWGCVDRTGRWVVQPLYDFVGPCRGGLLRIVKEGKNGFLTKDGQVVVEPRYSFAGEFKHGLAQVEEGGKVGYLNGKGQFVWPLTN